MTTPTTSQSTKAWGPAWLHQRPTAAAPLRASSSPTATKVCPLQGSAEMASYHEQCWRQMEARDYHYATKPRPVPDACPWCGGRLVHNPLCDDLRRSWEPTMPFGKYKGRPLSQVPPDYLNWLLARGGLDAQLQEAITQYA